MSLYVILYMSVITQLGWSALMNATWKGKTEIVEELVKTGANLNMRNNVRQLF